MFINDKKMSNPYLNYYSNQVGSGIPGFSGVRYQRGHGFFGRLFSGIGSFVKDLAPSLLKRSLPSAVNFAQDIMTGENVGQSAKNRLLEAGRDVADETLGQIKKRVQRGSGIYRRRLKYKRLKSRLLKAKTNKKRRKRKIR